MKHLMMLGALLLTTLGVAHADGIGLTDKVFVNGIFQGRYGGMQSQSGTWRSGSMDIRRAELGVLVKPTDKLSFKVQADFSTGTTVTKDLWIKYMVLPNAGVTFGQFVIPFGVENQTPDADLLTLERATFASTLFPSRRDRGGKLDLSLGRFNVVAAVVNGDGPNTKAPGNDKEGTVRVVVPLCPFAKLGASGLYGNNKLGTKDAFGGDVQVFLGFLDVTGEYVRAHNGGLDPEGWMVQAAVHFTPKDQFIAKYDSFNPDLQVSHKAVVVADTSTKVTPGNVHTYNFGVVHTVNKNLNLKLFYTGSHTQRVGQSNGINGEICVHF